MATEYAEPLARWRATLDALIQDPNTAAWQLGLALEAIRLYRRLAEGRGLTFDN
jgi:hypothetical protein